MGQISRRTPPKEAGKVSPQTSIAGKDGYIPQILDGPLVKTPPKRAARVTSKYIPVFSNESYGVH